MCEASLGTESRVEKYHFREPDHVSIIITLQNPFSAVKSLCAKKVEMWEKVENDLYYSFVMRTFAD